jgi:hypothetical protein
MIGNINNSLNSQHMNHSNRAQQHMQEIVKLPEQLNDDIMKLQNKMLNLSVQSKIAALKVDTYA